MTCSECNRQMKAEGSPVTEWRCLVCNRVVKFADSDERLRGLARIDEMRRLLEGKKPPKPKLTVIEGEK